MGRDEGPTEIRQGDFGREWTERNRFSPAELDRLYREKYGVSRTELNEQFLGKLPRDSRILEVGVNTGNELRALREMAFSELYGIDVLDYAIQRPQDDGLLPIFAFADARHLPFIDDAFDEVFTAGLLIHIPPSNVASALREITRVSSAYMWGFEYWAEEYTRIEYRGNDDLLWKANFATEYQRYCDLELIREDRLDYPDSDNVDTMFLLQKTG
jgi:pseudaminic acid biosynthesis-associated methylase